MVRDTFDKNAAQVKATVSKYDGAVPTAEKVEDGLLSAKEIRTNILLDMKDAVRQVNALRKGDQVNRSIDISMEQYVKDKFGFGSLDSFYAAIGVNPAFHTMENLASMPDFEEGYRWLRPEIIREAVRLGFRRNPIYTSLIAGEESVTQKKVTMPQINMSDATPEILGETETIPVGTVSFGEKDVKLRKIGTGLKVSDEVQKYVPLNILSLYLQDAGVKLGLGLDTMAIDVLINGDDTSGRFAAPVIGVADTTKGIQYIDMLRLWLRMGRLGRQPSGMISNEEPALKILMMDEFRKWSQNSANAKQNINLKIQTPIPQSQDYLVHGAMPSDGEKLGFIDNTSALIKLNASALQVESERIAERQLNGTYVTLETGFAKLFTDAFVILDGGQAFTSQGFPAFMDVRASETVLIK
nr:MAG TPA: major capsid protein [Caudoviricetes sp.]